jgi:hypothetical protein
MAAAELNQYDLVSLGPDATGWRAVINGSPVPVIAWGVYHWTKRRESDGSVVQDMGRIVSGVIANTQSVTAAGPAAIIKGFFPAVSAKLDGYLSPQMPNPHHA